ncbi:MAG: hypothetical protein M1837_002719 [Sclerophora amabilis]|nr:MAG: hypothetical protein M1837_002719 [Sclerophora amabilis]
MSSGKLNIASSNFYRLAVIMFTDDRGGLVPAGEWITARHPHSTFAMGQFDNLKFAIITSRLMLWATFTSAHSRTLTLAIRFEDDDTKADAEAPRLQAFLRTLDFPPAKEFIISETSSTPGWDVKEAIDDLRRAARKMMGRILIIIHYAGHGNLDQNNRLVFSASPQNPRSFLFNDLLWPFGVIGSDLQYGPQEILNLDVLIILDSCHAGAAKRGSPNLPLTVEVIGAVAADQVANGNAPDREKTTNETFTSKIADEIAHLRGQGFASVDLAEFVVKLRQSSSLRKPVHTLLVGRAPIRLPLKPPASETRPPPHPRPSVSAGSQEYNIRAVLSLHIHESLSMAGLRRLLDWIRALAPETRITVDSVYRTNSALMVLNVPLAVAYKMRNLPGIVMMAEESSRNILHRLEQLSLQPQTQP